MYYHGPYVYQNLAESMLHEKGLHQRNRIITIIQRKSQHEKYSLFVLTSKEMRT